MDDALVEWSPDVERAQAPERVRQKQEVPSPDGDRFPWVVPRAVVEKWEARTQKRALWHELPGTSLRVIYVLELGLHKHVLSKEQAEQLEGAVHEDARRALFYQSYKVRPAKTREVEGARLRLTRSREGLGAARALLMPDYDYDAARKAGYGVVASRDDLLVVEPASDSASARAQALTALNAWADEVREAALFPIHAKAFALPDITGEHRTQH